MVFWFSGALCAGRICVGVSGSHLLCVSVSSTHLPYRRSRPVRCVIVRTKTVPWMPNVPPTRAHDLRWERASAGAGWGAGGGEVAARGLGGGEGVQSSGRSAGARVDQRRSAASRGECQQDGVATKVVSSKQYNPQNCEPCVLR